MLGEPKWHLSIWRDVISGHCFQQLWNLDISLPGQGPQTWGSLQPWDVTPATGLSCCFPICRFYRFTAEKYPRKTHRHTRHWQDGLQTVKAGRCFDSTPWKSAPVAKPPLCPADTGGHPCRCTHRITWMHEHTYIHRSHSMTPLPAWQSHPDSRPSYWPQGSPHPWLLQQTCSTCPAWTPHPPDASP